MKKLLVLVLVLGMATMASAVPVMKLGDAAGAFGTGNTNITTVSAGGTYDLYVWASSDLVLNPDDITTGLDIAQVFLQYDTSKVNLTGGLIANLVALSNPFGTSWSGRSQGTYNSLGYAEGALINVNGVDAYALQQIVKMSLTVASLGATTTVTMTPNATMTHQSFQGNSVMGDQYFATAGSVTFVPEPMTIMLLGLGGLFLRRRK
jgi:hypothetical protein